MDKRFQELSKLIEGKEEEFISYLGRKGHVCLGNFEKITDQVRNICKKSHDIATLDSILEYGDTIIYRISYYGERKPREYAVGKRRGAIYYLEGSSFEYKYGICFLYKRIQETISSY